jgi:hypothetical protein
MFQEIRLLGTLGLALLGVLVAALAGIRKTRRVSRQQTDLDRAGQPLASLERSTFETVALSGLIVVAMLLLFLYFWSTVRDVQAIAPAVT